MVKKFIVADDKEYWRDVYAQVIKEAYPNAHIQEVRSGEELSRKALEEDIDGIITSNDMSRKDRRNDGVEAVRKIHADKPNLVMYVVSGKIDIYEVEGAKDVYYKNELLDQNEHIDSRWKARRHHLANDLARQVG